MWIVVVFLVALVIVGYLVGPPWRLGRRPERPVEPLVERSAEVSAQPAVEAVLGWRRELTEVGLSASRIAGALSHASYQEAMAALAAEDMARQPVVVPGD